MTKHQSIWRVVGLTSGVMVLMLLACRLGGSQTTSMDTAVTSTPSPTEVAVVASPTPVEVSVEEQPIPTEPPTVEAAQLPTPAGTIEFPLLSTPAFEKEALLPTLEPAPTMTPPDDTRAELNAYLHLPLSLAWEWGGEENNPAAVAIAGEKVFLLTTQGQLCILDANTGTEQMCHFLWPEEKEVASTEGQVTLTGDTVVVSAREIYIKPGERYSSIRSRLAAFSLDGQPLWAMPPAEEQKGNALVTDQGLVVSASTASPGDSWLTAFDITSGAEQWRVPGLLIHGASDGMNLYTESVSALRLATGEQLWEQKMDAQNLTYAGGYLYVASRQALVCLEAGTGQVVWQTDFAPFASSADYMDIVVAHGHVYVIPAPGTTHHGYRPGVMALDVATGQEQWSALTETSTSAQGLTATGDALVVVGTNYDADTDLLFILDAASGTELDRVTLGKSGAGRVTVAGDQVYIAGSTLRVYGPGQQETSVPQPISTRPPPTSASSTPTLWLTDQATPSVEQFPVTGRYAEVWARVGGAEGRLGKPLGPVIEGSFAEQHFERGLMHWGRLDLLGEPEIEVHVIVYGEGGVNTQAGDLWGRFIDYWQEGDDEYSCPQARPPLGPRRGFGKVWCQYVRDSVGAPLEEEKAIQAGYQNFQQGVMFWMPSDGGIYVLFNQGDWRFEPVE